MKTWLKNGLIGIVIGVIIINILSVIATRYSGGFSLRGLNTPILLVPFIIIYFIVGVFIGWVIEKFKK